MLLLRSELGCLAALISKYPESCRNIFQVESELCAYGWESLNERG